MKKQLLLKPLLTLALVMICGSVWGATTIDLTFDLSKNPGNSWPTANSTTLTNYTYELDGTNYTFSLKNVKCNSGYLMLTSTAVLGLPAMNDYKLVKIQARNSSGCSTSTKVGISSSSSSESYVSGGAIQTFSSTSSKYTYELSGTEFNTSYFIYVTNKNCQLTQLILTYEMSSNPVISASNVTIESDATSGEIAFSVTNPVEGKSLSASSADSWISNIAVSGNKVTFTATKNALHVERTGTITLKYEGANDKNVTVTQKKSSVFSSLEDLVEAGEPTKDGEEVTVSFEGVVIKEIITNGVYLDVYDTNNNSIEIYCKNVPTGWIAGGTVSATALTCPWKKNGSTWELCPTEWTGITYTAPVTYSIIINSTSNGEVAADVETAAAGVMVTLTVTPYDHCKLSELSVKKENDESVTVADNNTFVMPASNVTVSATFVAYSQHTISFNANGEEVQTKDLFEDEKVVFPSDPSEDGYTFMGWTAATSVNSDGTGVEFVKDGIFALEDASYNAVYAKKTSDESLVKMGSSDTFAAGDEIVIVAVDDKSNAFGLYQETIATSYVNFFTYSGMSSVSTDEKTTWTISEGSTSGSWKLGDANNGYLRNSSSNNLHCDNTETASDWTIVFVSNESKFTVAANGRYLSYRNDLSSNNYYRMAGASYATNGTYLLDIYKLAPAEYSNYTITIPKSYTAPISDAKYATLCLPFNYTVPEDVTAYTGEATNDGVTLTPIEGVIPANTGVIIYSETPGTYTFTGSAETPATIGKNDLVGVTETTTIPEGSYILALDTDDTAKFFEIDPKDNELAAYKAYLAIPEGVTPSKALAIRRGDATGIRTIEAQAVNQYFDLMGRKVQNPERGIYILNGKKVYVK